jgi:hypothetical protein
MKGMYYCAHLLVEMGRGLTTYFLHRQASNHGPLALSFRIS